MLPKSKAQAGSCSRLSTAEHSFLKASSAAVFSYSPRLQLGQTWLAIPSSNVL